MCVCVCVIATGGTDKHMKTWNTNKKSQYHTKLTTERLQNEEHNIERERERDHDIYKQIDQHNARSKERIRTKPNTRRGD